MEPRSPRFLSAALAALVLAACSVRPEPVHLGADECAHCRMLITDRRFAAQLLTDRGRAYTFDAIECMAAFVRADNVPADRIHSLLVTDYDAGDAWIDARTAHFLSSPSIRSPMGSGLAAHATEHGAREHQRSAGGQIIGWEDVLRIAGEHDHTGHDERGPHTRSHGGHDDVD